MAKLTITVHDDDNPHDDIELYHDQEHDDIEVTLQEVRTLLEVDATPRNYTVIGEQFAEAEDDPALHQEEYQSNE